MCCELYGFEIGFLRESLGYYLVVKVYRLHGDLQCKLRQAV